MKPGDAIGPGGEPYARVFETHTSVITLIGDRAYKTKKPVRLPFVDLSTRDRRLEVCVQEVELNRRTAPDVYLGVTQLHDLIGPTGVENEPVVVMRRMPAARCLSVLLADPAQYARARRCVEDVAQRVARFHAALPGITDVDLPGEMARLWRDGMEQTEIFAGDLLEPGRARRVVCACRELPARTVRHARRPRTRRPRARRPRRPARRRRLPARRRRPRARLPRVRRRLAHRRCAARPRLSHDGPRPARRPRARPRARQPLPPARRRTPRPEPGTPLRRLPRLGARQGRVPEVSSR